VKHSIVGDPVYGVSKELRTKYFNKELTLEDRLTHIKAPRMMLHANSLEFELYHRKYSIKSKFDFKNEIDSISL
jgi:23S rRNA pseudouridine1911/1915/1917 synthase